MATTLATGPETVQLAWNYQDVTGPGITINANRITYSQSLTTGQGAGNADTIYVDTLTIAASGTATVDLFSCPDLIKPSQHIGFFRVKGLYISLASGGASSILIGGAGSTPFVNWITSTTAQVRVRSGMAFFLEACIDATGYLVGSGNNLKLTNEDGANAATVFIRVIGTQGDLPPGSMDFSNPLDGTLNPAIR